MIYEMAVVARHDLGDQGVTKIQDLVLDVVKSRNGEIVISDDWGSREFAQTTSRGIEKGRYLYFIYKSTENANAELERKFRISDDVMRSLIVKMGDDETLPAIMKNYKTPYSKKYHGSIINNDAADSEDEGMGAEKDQRKFSRRKTCWFSAKKIKADWKDPNTYAWLLNEFGKISPARVSGISQKHQRFSTTAIKRARQIGLASFTTNRVVE
jgi:ribosomal protein S18/ribosomal protein S6